MKDKLCLDVKFTKELIKCWYEKEGKIVKNIKINTLANIDVELEE